MASWVVPHLFDAGAVLPACLCCAALRCNHAGIVWVQEGARAPTSSATASPHTSGVLAGVSQRSVGGETELPLVLATTLPSAHSAHAALITLIDGRVAQLSPLLDHVCSLMCLRVCLQHRLLS